MTEPTWREIRDLTRLRRKQAATVRHGVTADAHRIIKEYVPIGGVEGLHIRLWNFQSGRCYMCAVRFTKGGGTRATREHVKPRSRGHGTENNILLACADCNNRKGDRPPTQRELDMLVAWLKGDGGDRIRFTILMLTAETDPEPPAPSHTVSAKRTRQTAEFNRLMYAARQRRTRGV